MVNGPATNGGTVLHVGDVAGVAVSLCRALDDWTEWRTAAVRLPTTGAGAGRVVHAAAVPWRAVQTPGVVRRAARETRADVVHLHWARSAPLLLPSRAALVVHAHGSDVRRRTSRGFGRMVWRAMERADTVLVSTPDLIDDVPSGRWLPNPVDIDFFSMPLGEEVTRSAPQEVFIHARLSEVKGGAILVDAAAELRRRRPDVVIRALGGGPLDAAAAAAGVRIESAAESFGVRDRLRRADVVIGQQRLRMLGLCELEAMAVGKPVVAPISRGSYPALVPTVDAEGAEAVAEAVVGLLEDGDERRRLGELGRQYVSDIHAPPAVAGRLAAIYRTIARP